MERKRKPDRAERNEKRRRLKQAVCAVAAAAILVGGIFFVFNWSQNKERRDRAERISAYGPRKGVPRSIEDLQKAIAAYEDLQEMHVRDAAQTATYWKILSTRFRDKGMFLEAVKALRRAIEIMPDDEELHYLAGLNAAQAAKSMHEYGALAGAGESKQSCLNLAEAAYLRAIELESDYTQARYALAVLYVFELDRPADAAPQLLRYMENTGKNSGDADAMFLLARAFYMMGRNEEAAEWYERGIPLSKDAARKTEAEANLNYIRGLRSAG